MILSSKAERDLGRLRELLKDGRVYVHVSHATTCDLDEDCSCGMGEVAREIETLLETRKVRG